MKKLIIGAVVVAIVGGLGVYGGKLWEIVKNEPFVAENLVPETIIKTERVNELDARIEEAKELALPDIEAIAEAEFQEAIQAAELAREKYVSDRLQEVTDGVKEDYIAEIEETIVSTEY